MSINSKMTAIADAIRDKTGKTEEMTLDQMATEIAAIETGGGNSSFSLTLTADGTNAQSFIDAVCLALDVKNGFYAKGSAENSNQEEYSRALAIAYCCGEHTPNSCTGYRYRNGVTNFQSSLSFNNWDFITKVGDVFEVTLF